MKNFKIFVPIIIACIIIGNALFFFNMYVKELNFQKKILVSHAEEVSNSIEKFGMSFENDINYILYSSDFKTIYKSDKNSDLVNKLKYFYSKYPNLITSIKICDNKQNVFNIYRDKNDVFLTDIFTSRDQIQINFHEKVDLIGTQQNISFPFFDNNHVVGNIIVYFDLRNYFKLQLGQSSLNKSFGLAIFDSYGNMYCNQKSIGLYRNPKLLKVFINIAQSNYTVNVSVAKINQENSANNLIAYSPMVFLNSKYGITCFLNIRELKNSMYFNVLFSILWNLVIFAIILFLYLKMVRTKDVEESKLRESEEVIKQILELMPIGIIIINNLNRVVSINKSAQAILMIDECENLIGQDISHRFFLGKTLLIDAEYSAAYESNHFLHYEKDGNEVVIYKKDIPLKLRGEEVIIQSFIDVTPIEKSRKREIAANMAKSEFLAKMSHEIRTPMNGIIGMSDSLAIQNLTPEQNEQVSIIKKSADLLLNILNDILDLSKIEAGKMSLEEIPFKIKDEITLAVELFRAPAEEKKLKIGGFVSPDIPENILGDPFRLRQILMNLIGNAIKFTHEGEIRIGVNKIEDYDRNLTLQFVVEDTGIGIPREKLSKIFQSFAQADNSTTRKYGGTGLGTAISKQLVELMNGEIHVDSPSSISNNPKFPGSKFVFTIEVYSNEIIKKDINIQNITAFNKIKTLIIGENKSEEKTIIETLSFFNLPIEHQVFHKNTIEMLKKNAFLDEPERYKLLIIRDTADFDGFKLIARMNDAKLTGFFKIVIISTNDRPGNYVRSKRNGVDFYLIFPYETSEIYNFLCETYTALNLEEEKSKFKVHQLKMGLKILVAEDNAINQKVAKTLFKNIGYEVEFAKHGLEVLEMVKRTKYDIIFMDIMMPEMDGIQATIELRKLKNEVPIIAMTANIAKDEKANAIASGMNDYITKPVRIDTVKKILIKLFSEEI